MAKATPEEKTGSRKALASPMQPCAGVAEAVVAHALEGTATGAGGQALQER